MSVPTSGAGTGTVDGRRADVIPPFRAGTCDPATAQSSRPSRSARRSSVSSAACRRDQTPAWVQSRSRRQAVAPEQPTLSGNIAPGDAGPQHIHDARKGRPVRNTQSTWVVAAAFGSGQQQRSDPLPQGIRNKISAHPDTLPTKIAERKGQGSTHFETIS